MAAYISDFTILPPSFSSPQQATLDWMIAAHTQAENPTSPQDFQAHITAEFQKVGCKPDVIAKRGHFITDFLHQDWENMQVYQLQKSPTGQNLGARQHLHQEICDGLFSQIYEEKTCAPDNIIHVSCTGYASPSAAQKAVSRKNWGDKTAVTHAYHMGCYGSIPALRIASGFQGEIDVVHTELCSLHFNPALHARDQLVAQSLFADGCIRYQVSKKKKQGLKILAIHEEIIKDSEEAMKWYLTDWGFQLALSKELPLLIATCAKKFLENLCKKAYQNPKEIIEQAVFAIHPGGPKILQHIQKLFSASDWQLAYSRTILQNHGNMSSATLPHIWEKIVNDPSIKPGTKVLSMAFGPGLTIAGLIMEKV